MAKKKGGRGVRFLGRENKGKEGGKKINVVSSESLAVSSVCTFKFFFSSVLASADER